MGTYWNPENGLDAYSELIRDGEMPPGENRLTNPRPSILDILARNQYDPNRLILADIPGFSPLFIDFSAPQIGPLLITGSTACGKTDFLHAVARSVELGHDPGLLTYHVLTHTPDEWLAFSTTPRQHNQGITSLASNASQDLLLSLASWAHGSHDPNKQVVLLVDDLATVSSLDFDARQNLRWLLLYGPARQVWPIITYNKQRSQGMEAWNRNFVTRIESRGYPYYFFLRNQDGVSDSFYVPTLDLV